MRREWCRFLFFVVFPCWTWYHCVVPSSVVSGNCYLVPGIVSVRYRIEVSICRNIEVSIYRHIEISKSRYIGISNFQYMELSKFRYVETSKLRYIDISKYRSFVVSEYRSFDISKCRTCFALDPLASSCYSCRYWMKAIFDALSVSESYNRLIFLLIDIVSNSIPISISNTKYNLVPDTCGTIVRK